ncbi:MAG: tail fiber domain-containing protein, partial [Lachnospiraceae bacterium]|nr:tail fiber domain-containing protein [Lachnospiraceae bacterium]
RRQLHMCIREMDSAAAMNTAINDLKNTKLNKNDTASSAYIANSFKVPRVDTDVNTLPGVFTGTIKEQMKTSANLPTSEYYHVITLEGGDANYNTQLAIGMTTTAMYYRNRQNGTWSAWYEIVLGQIVNGLFELQRGVRFKGSIITLDSFRVNAGNKIRMWSDNEGGNLEIESPDGVKAQMDLCGNVFRIYMQKSDGSLVFPFNINPSNGYVNIPYLSSTGEISTNKLSIGNVIVNKDGDFQHASNNKKDGWGILNNAGQVKFGVTYEDGTLFAGNAIIIPDSNGGIFYFGGSINPDRQYPMLKITQFTNSLQILPTQANTCTIGHTEIPLEAVTAKNIYNSSGLITSSDRNKKKDFAEITEDFAEQIIDGLIPTSFKYRDGDSGRTHYGLVAQYVEKLLEELGIDSKDFAPLIKKHPAKEVENEDGSRTLVTDYDAEPEYFLRYEGFIGLIIKYIQGLKQENKEMKDKMSQLEDRLELLESKLNSI